MAKRGNRRESLVTMGMVKLYIEGGGDQKRLKSECRRAFLPGLSSRVMLPDQRDSKLALLEQGVPRLYLLFWLNKSWTITFTMFWLNYLLMQYQ